MRNNPTEPEKRLWRHLSNSQLGGWKFRRQQVIGHFIADFVCPSAKLIVEVDGDTHADPLAEVRRDDALAAFGYRVIHVTNADVMHNLEGVLLQLIETLNAPSPLPFRGGAGGGASQHGVALAERPHPNPSPEGEGLEKVEAQKLLGISLEGSVG